MLASAVANVLAPPWSGRPRRPKQGSSEVEHEPQDCGHNANPSTSLRQGHRQQPFFASQKQAERALQDPNDNGMQFTARISCSSPGWQKENNSPNVTTTVQSKRAIMKSPSVDVYRATMYNNAELHHVPTPLNTGQVPRFLHSEEHRGYRVSRTEDQNEPFKSLSSRPTTSSQLLSLRQANLKRSDAETTQMQTQKTRSVRSFTLFSRGTLKNSQLYSADDQARDTLGSYLFPDTPSKTEKISETIHFPFSPRSKRIVTRGPLFLKKKETDISKNPEASVARDDEQKFPNFTSKSSSHGIFKAQPHSHLLTLRKYCNTEGDSSNNAIQQNFNINKNPETFSHNSSKDKTNLNKIFPQTGVYVRNIKLQSKQNTPDSNSMNTRAFTVRSNILPKKKSFSVDEISTANGGQIYLDSKKCSQLSHSSMDLSSHLSPRRCTRGFGVPGIYSYMQKSSPALFTPNCPSTPSSPIQRVKNSYSPLQVEGEIFQADRRPLFSRYTFNIHAQGFSSSPTCPAQSLPADFGRKSAPRLSTSPYSTLISSRPALNSTLLSAPPGSKSHDQSTCNDTPNIHVYPIKDDLSSSPFIKKTPKKQLGSPNREQRTANTVQACSCDLDNHKPARPCFSQASQDASFVMESQRTNITPCPRQQNTSSHGEHGGSIAVQLNKGNSYLKHRLSKKVTAECETLRTVEKETADLNTLEKLQETPNSKKGLFALWVKKDSVSTSDPMADRDDVTPQYLKTRRNLPILKASSKIDQMLNLLKQTFGGKRSDNTVDMKNDKTTTHQPLGQKSFKQPKKEGIKCFESQSEPSLINDKSSLTSLSPSSLMKYDNTLNVDVQNRVGREGKPNPNFMRRWEAPNSSLTTDKASLPSLESLSPLTFRKSEETLNVDQHKRWSDENGKHRPHRLKAHGMNRPAILPHYRNSSAGPPSPFNLFQYDSKDIQNDNVFHSPVSKKSNSLYESDSSPHLNSTKSTVHQSLTRSCISSSCADLKYGLNNGKSFSVSSVVSSRPSGPGRISTSSASDLSSLEDFRPRRLYSRFDSSIDINYFPTYAKSVTSNQSQPGYTLSDDHLQSTDKQENSTCFWDEPVPTPPSPRCSPSRCISQVASVSSPIWKSPDSPSPHGILPSRSYSTSLTVFEESSSDTTTDDEYYLDNGDEVETEL